jgi:hypothetical protein
MWGFTKSQLLHLTAGFYKGLGILEQIDHYFLLEKTRLRAVGSSYKIGTLN